MAEIANTALGGATSGMRAGTPISPSSTWVPSEVHLGSNGSQDDDDYGATKLAASNPAVSVLTGAIIKYKMRGMDRNINGTYDVWFATGTPDFTGAQYAGGLTTPLRDIVITGFWAV